MENKVVSNFNKAQLENFFFNSSVDINIKSFIFAIILSAILAFLIKFT